MSHLRLQCNTVGAAGWGITKHEIFCRCWESSEELQCSLNYSGEFEIIRLYIQFHEKHHRKQKRVITIFNVLTALRSTFWKNRKQLIFILFFSLSIFLRLWLHRVCFFNHIPKFLPEYFHFLFSRHLLCQCHLFAQFLCCVKYCNVIRKLKSTFHWKAIIIS
jgi:hypothetical protein